MKKIEHHPGLSMRKSLLGLLTSANIRIFTSVKGVISIGYLPSNDSIDPLPFIDGNKCNNQRNYSGILARKAGNDIFKISIGVLVLMDRLLPRLI